MSCIYKYKGKKYSEEQFKEYFINNKQEFATSIAKNKDVIDSFKRKMEGIDFVFSQSPELASVGSKAQYLQYLSTIFPDSKVKDIVYHFSNTKIDKPNKEKFSLSANINRRKGFFGIDKNVNPGNNFANVEGIIPNLMLFNMKNPDSGDFSVLPPIVAKDETRDSAIIKQRGNINYYVVFEPEQIHILGSKQDIEGFKSFIKSNTKTVRKGAITPSIKGHAQFATDNGIGWFRSDEQFITSKEYPSSFKGNYGDTWEKRNNIWYTIDSDGVTHKRDDLTDTDVYAIYDNQYGNKNYLQKGELTKTRRILEVQSDIFQKSRDIKSPDEIINELKKSGELQIKCD